MTEREQAFSFAHGTLPTRQMLVMVRRLTGCASGLTPPAPLINHFGRAALGPPLGKTSIECVSVFVMPPNGRRVIGERPSEAGEAGACACEAVLRLTRR